MKKQLLLATTLGLFLLAAPALAQTADELKTRGNQSMLDLNYADALASYQAALAKSPGDVALYYNIGRAEQALGNYPAALDALTTFDTQAPAQTKAKVPSLAQLIADVRARVGELSIHCSSAVQGTVVVGDLARLDGCDVAPRSVRVGLSAKSVEIAVRLESKTYRAEPMKVILTGGGPPADVLLAVTPFATTGFLRITALPANAIIALDGAAKGNSPLELETSPGSHIVDVTADSYEKRHLPVVVELGQRRDLSVTLEKTPAITKRWWFWTGAGIVAAGIATTVIILAVQSEKSASKGTIDPGTVRAPLVTF